MSHTTSSALRAGVPRGRPASKLALVALLAAMLAGAPGRAAEEEPAQAAPAAEPAPQKKPSVEDFSKPMGPPDPFNRGTPRGTMYGFIVATRESDYERAAEYLDLRRLPPEQREEGRQLARQFKAVLDQTFWVDFAALSDSNDGLADDGLPDWQDRLADIETEQGLVTLLLQRVPRDEDKVRIWKISSTTVVQIPVLYAEFGPVWLEAWLPASLFEIQILDAALYQWLGLLVVIFLATLVALGLAATIARIVAFVGTRGGRTIDPRILHLVRGPVRLAITVLLFSSGKRSLALGVPVMEFFGGLERLLLVVSLAWLTFRLIDLAALAIRVRQERLGNLAMLPILLPTSRFAKALIVIIGGLAVLGTLGVNISAAVAGLGVGGIAFALAAQKTIENLFGGVTLFADRPVQVGDFFKYGDNVGTVEEIGLRSTRVRTLDRTVVSIPNAEFSNLQLENFATRDRMRLFTILGVRYETTPDQLRYLLARLREILLAHPRITDDPARVRLVSFGAYSIDLEVFAYANTADWNEFLQIREDIFLRFMDAIAEAGTGFAFPSSTTYVGRDDGLDEDRKREAEARVEEWCEKGELPFPRFSEQFTRERQNTLEWPPEGSPDSPSRARRGAGAEAGE